MRLLASLLVLAMFGPLSSAAEPDRELHALKKAGDLRTLERYCRERLLSDQLPADARAEYVAELAASLAQQANLITDTDRRERLWDEAEKFLAEFVKANLQHPRSMLMQRQRLIYMFARGEAWRQHAEWTNSLPALRKAQAALQQAEVIGVQLEEALKTQLDAYRSKRVAAGSFDQLVALSNDVPFRIALVRLSLAKAHPDKSEERARYLAAAMKGLEFYVREGFNEDEVIIRSHVAMAECQQLRGDHAEAIRLLLMVTSSKNTSPFLKDHALALHMNVLLERNRPSEALRLVQGRPKLSPELTLSFIHALLVEARQLAERGNKESAARSQTDAMERLDGGESEFGAGWTNRACALAGRLGSTDWLPANAAAAARLGECFLQVGRADQAVAAYDRAITLAKQPALVFEYQLSGAKALAQSGKDLESAERLAKLSEQAMNPEQAANAHLLAVQTYFRLWRKNKAADASQRLKQAIAGHLQRHGSEPTAIEVRVFAGLLDAEEGRPSAALQHFAKVPAEHELFEGTLRESVRVWESLAESVTVDGVEALRISLLTLLDAREKELAGRGRSTTRIEIAVTRARLLVRPNASSADLQTAERALQESLQNADISPSQRDMARLTLLLAYIALKRSSDAVELLRQEWPPAQIDALHQRLRKWSEQIEAEDRAAVATAQFTVIRRLLERDTQTPDLRRELRREEAWALVHMGNRDAARERFIALRRDWPRDAQLLEDHARALSQFGTPTDLNEAITLWQTLAAGRKEGAAGWFEAKYQLAQALHRAGQTPRARQVLRVTYELWLKNAAADDTTLQTFKRRFQEAEQALGK